MGDEGPGASRVKGWDFHVKMTLSLSVFNVTTSN